MRDVDGLLKELTNKCRYEISLHCLLSLHSLPHTILAREQQQKLINLLSVGSKESNMPSVFNELPRTNYLSDSLQYIGNLAGWI